MADKFDERMDQLLQSIAEETNAEIPYQRLHDGILFAQKRKEKKRRTLIRSVSTAASLVVLLSVGTFFVSHMGFGAVANDTAALTIMEASADTVVEESAPAEMEAMDGAAYTAEFQSPDGAKVDCDAAVQGSPAEVPAASQPYAGEKRNEDAGHNNSSAPAPSAEPSFLSAAGAAGDLASELSALAADVEHILICEVKSSDAYCYSAIVTTSLRGMNEGPVTFFAPEGIFDAGESYLLLLDERDGMLCSASDEIFFRISGENIMIFGLYEETLPLSELLDLLGLS